MRSCSPQSLLDDAKCFLCLTEKQLDLVIVEQLRLWLSATTPDADVTAQGLMDEAVCLLCLPVKQLLLVQTQLLCELDG